MLNTYINIILGTGTGGVQGQGKGQRLMGIKVVNDSIGLKFLDLGLLSLSYDLCIKHQFASLFATFGKNIDLRVLPAYRKKFGCLPLNPL